MLDVHRKCNGNGNDPRAGCCDNVLPSDIIIIYQVYNMYRTTLLGQLLCEIENEKSQIENRPFPIWQNRFRSGNKNYLM